MVDQIMSRRPALLALLTTIATMVVVASTSASTPRAPSPPAQRPVVVQVDGGGFDWGDAAIGAAGAAGFVLLLVGLATAARHDRSP
jgi:hypothetical protein